MIRGGAALAMLSMRLSVFEDKIKTSRLTLTSEKFCKLYFFKFDYYTGHTGGQ